uniref:Uncharacterized protein n=1 Tax=Aegilops tauschii subsp. strangulata TaxID=200361 RepID=A0A453GH73_AEGTS
MPLLFNLKPGFLPKKSACAHLFENVMKCIILVRLCNRLCQIFVFM